MVRNFAGKHLQWSLYFKKVKGLCPQLYYKKCTQCRYFPIKLSSFSSEQQLRKKVHIRSFSGPYFPAFRLNTERYSVSFRIQFEYGKMQTRKTPNMDNFYAVSYSIEKVLTTPFQQAIPYTLIRFQSTHIMSMLYTHSETS